MSFPEVSLTGVVGYYREVQSRDPRWPPRVYTDVIVPAADLHSHPTTFQVVSDRKLGDLRDEITVRCELRSSQSKRVVQTKDGPREFPDLRLSLRAVQ